MLEFQLSLCFDMMISQSLINSKFYFVYIYIYLDLLLLHQLMIPYIVLQEGETFCEKDEFWPNTPAGDTVINRTCEEGRVGYKSRTCNGNTWQDVFFHCVDQELKTVTKSAVCALL